MEFLNKIKITLLNTRKSIKRFPITFAISSLLSILLIYLNETNISGEIHENIKRLSFVLGLGIPLSLCIELLIERFFKIDKLKSFILYITSIALLAMYYFVFLKDYEVISMIRYSATIMSLALASLYVSRIGKKEGYEFYIMDVYSGFTLTFIYSFVLYVGLAAIIFMIDQLFNINVRADIYYYMFLIVFFIFAASLFLSKLPSSEEEYSNVEYKKSLKILLLYIVIPLITIYTLILYIYLLKLFTIAWPKGLVSHLIIWYSTISIGIIFLITPILEENQIAKIFKVWFPKIILPVLFTMFISIYLRVNQYGITENRYFLIALGLWVLGIMIYFSIKKPLNNILIPISLSIIILNSVFGPLSSFAISKYSQNKRFESILIKNNMLIDGVIVKNENISSEDKNEIINIISYFYSKDRLNDIKVLPDNFEFILSDNMKNVFGFEYESYYPNQYENERDKYFSYHTRFAKDTINISGYDYYSEVSSWNNNWNDYSKNMDKLVIDYNIDDVKLTISKYKVILLKQDMTSVVKDIHEKIEKEFLIYGPRAINYEDMTYETYVNVDSLRIDIKLIIREIQFRTDYQDNLNVDTIDFILLVGTNNE